MFSLLSDWTTFKSPPNFSPRCHPLEGRKIIGTLKIQQMILVVKLEEMQVKQTHLSLRYHSQRASERASEKKKTAHMPSYPITKCITKRKSYFACHILFLMRICHYLLNEIQVVALTQTHRDFWEQPRNSTFEGIREIENVTLGW